MGIVSIRRRLGRAKGIETLREAVGMFGVADTKQHREPGQSVEALLDNINRFVILAREEDSLAVQDGVHQESGHHLRLPGARRAGDDGERLSEGEAHSLGAARR